jgi:hypothetical protein
LKVKKTYLSLGGDNLALSDTLALGGHGERLLELLAEDDVLDEHALDLDTPLGGHVLDDLADALGDLLAALNDVLQHAGAHDVAQRGLGPLDQGLAHVGDAEGGLVGRDNLEVQDAGELGGDVVLGHARLLGDLADLDLDVDLEEVFGQRVDLDEARVDGLVEAAELGDEADVALADALEGVREADAQRDGATGANELADGVGHGAVPARVVHLGDDGGIALLEILGPRGFHLHDLRWPETAGAGGGMGAIIGGLAAGSALVRSVHDERRSWMRWFLGRSW